MKIIIDWTKLIYLIDRLLDWSIDPTKFRPMESIELFYALSSDDIATNSLFDFFMIKFDEIFNL